ncbi:MAG: hypothetical protein RIE74_09155, partial [Pseudomonadales bacterium]
MSRARLVLWGVPALLWAAFFVWYTNLSGPMTAAEIEAVVARLSAEGGDPVRIATLRRFMEEDTGRQFLMANLLDAAEAPPALGGMLSPTFAFVFRSTLEKLQSGDRFYYLARREGLSLLPEVEAH